MTITCFADEIAQDYETDSEAAETLIRDRVQRGQKLTVSDYAFLKSRLAWDSVKTNDQYRRVSMAMNLAAICGTPEGRKASQKEATTAAEVYEKEAPKLEEQIQKLQAKLRGLENDKNLSAKRVQEQLDAVKKSREYTPPFIRKRVDQARKILDTEGIGAELRAATARIHELKCILNVDSIYPGQKEHIEYALKRLLPEAVKETLTGPPKGNQAITYSYSPTWLILKPKCEIEFALLNRKLPELQRKYDEALAIVEAPLAYYSDPANWLND